MPLTHIAKTLRQFLKRIEQIKEAWKSKKEGEPGRRWYRGLQKSHWPLLPKLYRPRNKIGELLAAEDEIREEFVRRAPGLTAYKPANVWEWYYLMQHYGAPTRLLDWTENPQSGLYFAVKDRTGLHDAAVWILDPWWLNGIVFRKNRRCTSAGFTRSRGRRRARLDEIFPKPTDHLAKIVIPSYATKDVQGELQDYGVDEAKSLRARQAQPGACPGNSIDF